jgi:hypothetical protein
MLSEKEEINLYIREGEGEKERGGKKKRLI